MKKWTSQVYNNGELVKKNGIFTATLSKKRRAVYKRGNIWEVERQVIRLEDMTTHYWNRNPRPWKWHGHYTSEKNFVDAASLGPEQVLETFLGWVCETIWVCAWIGGKRLSRIEVIFLFSLDRDRFLEIFLVQKRWYTCENNYPFQYFQSVYNNHFWSVRQYGLWIPWRKRIFLGNLY